MNTQDRINEFFATHPDSTECYEALGKVFADKEKANSFLAGVAGRYVTTHSREGQNFERVSDKLRFEIVQQQNLVNVKHQAYEDAGGMDKETAMGEWTAAKDKLQQLEIMLEKQLDLEEKEELLSKEDKEIKIPLAPKPLTLEELKTAVANQEQIVETNVKLIEKITNAGKKKKAEKQQAEEVEKLESLKKQLEEMLENEKASGTETFDHEVTQEDLDNNPQLVTDGVKVGDTIKVPVNAETAETGTADDNNGSNAPTE